jgi:hypothetical protein
MGLPNCWRSRWCRRPRDRSCAGTVPATARRTPSAPRFSAASSRRRPARLSASRVRHAGCPVDGNRRRDGVDRGVGTQLATVPRQGNRISSSPAAAAAGRTHGHLPPAGYNSSPPPMLASPVAHGAASSRPASLPHIGSSGDAHQQRIHQRLGQCHITAFPEPAARSPVRHAQAAVVLRHQSCRSAPVRPADSTAASRPVSVVPAGAHALGRDFIGQEVAHRLPGTAAGLR